MLYFLAILLPPVAVLLCGRPMSALLNLVLCLFLWIPGIVHACFVVSEAKQDKRYKNLEKAVRSGQMSR